MRSVKIGTAGWTVPRQWAGEFPAEGSALERYASRFPIAEINSSFHRPHRLSTWQRWRDSTPAGFRFAVKLPKTITHQQKLIGCAGLLEAFAEQAETLGEKLAVVLVQLPPKLAFEAAVAESFFAALRARLPVAIACEPRHPSWFETAAGRLLEAEGIARVAADPAIVAAEAAPGAWGNLSYWRLHGSPAMYRSSYADRIADYAHALAGEAAGGREVWCVFDNTASAAATGDALALMNALR